MPWTVHEGVWRPVKSANRQALKEEGGGGGVGWLRGLWHLDVGEFAQVKGHIWVVWLRFSI